MNNGEGGARFFYSFIEHLLFDAPDVETFEEAMDEAVERAWEDHFEPRNPESEQ